jgi:hypothetical protein
MQLIVVRIGVNQCPQIGIGLDIWNGFYQGVFGNWLRFFDADGQWIPSPEEELVKERQEKIAAFAEIECLRALLAEKSISYTISK